jgi:FkbM family methyltransferase
MLRFTASIFMRVFGRRMFQPLYAAAYKALGYLQGIGKGSSVACSGEVSVVVGALRDTRPRVSGRSVTFDVGANVGKFSGSINKEIGYRFIEIHAYEPSEKTFKTLSQRLSGHNNIIANNVGLSDRVSGEQLFYDVALSGMVSMVKRDLSAFGIEQKYMETVSLITLDGYCQEMGVSHIDLLKIDVEGHELSVMRGADMMLRGNAIATILFEFGGCNVDSRTYPRDFNGHPTDMGYRWCCRVLPSGQMIQIPRHEEMLERFRKKNCIFSLEGCNK